MANFGKIYIQHLGMLTKVAWPVLLLCSLLGAYLGSLFSPEPTAMTTSLFTLGGALLWLIGGGLLFALTALAVSLRVHLVRKAVEQTPP